MTNTTPDQTLFESEYCGRCGGSGKYSFNLMHGDSCYGCGGSGVRLTKRGRVAQAFLDAMRIRPASEVKVGDLIEFDIYFCRFFARVESIEPDTINGGGRFNIIGTRPKTGESVSLGCLPQSTVRIGFTAEEKQAMRQKALAYQATLNKLGKPLKRVAIA